MSVLLLTLALTTSQTQEPAIVPRPQSLEMLGGTAFEIKRGTVVLEKTDEPSVSFLIDLVKKCTGEAPKVVRSAPRDNRTPVITLEQVSDLPTEGYRLFAQDRDMVVSYSSDAGLFYAIQTLRQLLPAEIESERPARGTKWVVPAVRISDAPRYSWRGMHLDVSRHFFPVSFIKKYIDFIAMNKMNTFHWHLVDDGGWRMQVDKYPMLTSVGAWRVDTGKPWSYGDLRFVGKDGADKTYGGFYTKDQIRDIVAYAAKRHVNIVPEIEMPGHNLAALVSYPELGCDGVTPFPEAGGSNTDVFCPGKESTFTFLEDVLTETMDLFPSKYIHIGGDEVGKEHWQNCASCQARMKAEGLKDENELQSYFVRRIEKFLIAHDRKLVGWDEILEGGLAPEATVMSWRGEDGGIAAAQAGHDVVMSPTSHCYFDYSYATTSTKHVYGWEPTPQSLTPEEAKHVLGGQANVWTEFIPTEQRAEYMVFPRMLATAEDLWTNDDRRDWDSFSSRMMRQFARLDAMDVSYQIPAPDVDYTAAVFSDSA
ncbi:MAG TPA: beta-N-acetylhexosaminidase, partial [Fimbriimonadaceae bacterium]|nr:beta-N-acetylhexosaminidase [Fimbriimonadaceae bacterium]